MAGITAKGTILQVFPGSTTTAATAIADVVSIGGPAAERPGRIDTTVMGTTGQYRTAFSDGFIDPGTVDMTINYDPRIAQHSNGSSGIAGLFDAGTTKTWRIIVAGASSGQKIVFPAYVSAFNPSFVTDDKVTADFSLQVTGAITWP